MVPPVHGVMSWKDFTLWRLAPGGTLLPQRGLPPTIRAVMKAVFVSAETVAPAATDDTPVDQLVRQARIRMLYSHVRVTVLGAPAS
jgi:hypothetical protein